MWEAQLAKLAAYKAAHGDCHVPKGWAEDPRLSRWVSNQRKSKKALDRGEPSLRMTAARAARLEALGLTWETLDATWKQKLARLAAYKKVDGDCNVPHRWAEDPSLGKWVHNQRQGKKALDRGKPSPGMTAARAARLDALGFEWNPRSRLSSEERLGQASVARAHGTASRRTPGSDGARAQDGV